MNRNASLVTILVLLVAALALMPMSAQAAKSTSTQTFNVLPLVVSNINITSVSANSTGQLIGSGVATFSLKSHSTTALFDFVTTFHPTTGPCTGACAILHLQVGAIDLNLLGLDVQTSKICLNICAQPGTTLGDLLCSIASALDVQLGLGLSPQAALNVALSQIGLSQIISTLTSQLTNLLNEVLKLVTDASAASKAVCGQTDILFLSLGPVQLDLLGLTVSLDNCAGGPITVQISTQPNTLLGNLICDLANLFASHSSQNAILSKLKEIAAAIAALL